MKKFETQLIEHIPRLRRYARALTTTVCAADDLVQDTLERALNKKNLWQQNTRLRPWLFTLMHNLYINQLKQLQNRPMMQELDETISDAAASPESAINMQQLNVCIDKLPAEQKEIFLLVSLEGFAYEEVARIIDIPVGTVMSRLSRAREKLRKHMLQTHTLPLRRVK